MEDQKEWKECEDRVRLDLKLSRVSAVKVPTLVIFIQKKPIRKKSAIDICAGVDGRALFFDVKCTRERLWNLKKYVLHEKKIHQYAQLLGFEEQGNKSGYLIFFKDYKLICWFPTGLIKKYLDQGELSLHPGMAHSQQSEDEPIDIRKLVFA